MNFQKGYLYVAIGEKYRREAEISARSLRQHTNYPICIITDNANFKSQYFDEIIVTDIVTDFASKIIGLQLSPFSKTVFLDSDTFVCLPIDNLFDLLDRFDMAMAVDVFGHSRSFIQKYRPDYILRYEDILPEYNTGVIAFQKNSKTQAFLSFWLQKHDELQFKADMPSFREAYIDFHEQLLITPLLAEYNYYELYSFGILHGPVRVLHARLGSKWNTLTSIMLPYEKMSKIALRLNKRANTKRIFITNIGVISANYNIRVIKNFIKTFLGIKKTKKKETY